MQHYKVFSQQAGCIVGEVSTIVPITDVAGATNGHSWKFYLKGESGTEQGFWVWYHVLGLAELNPVTGVFRGIEVTISSGDADTVVAAATRAAIAADGMAWGLSVVTGAGANVVITGRFPQNTTNCADVDTGYGFTTTTAGSTTVAVNAKVDGSATTQNFVIRPPRAGATSLIYLRKLILSVADTAFTDATTYGAVAGLTNGISCVIRDHDAVTLATIFTGIKNNGALLGLGDAVLFDALQAQIVLDLVQMFGGELAIDGSKCQDLAFQINDDCTGLTGHYLGCFGHYSASVS